MSVLCSVEKRGVEAVGELSWFENDWWIEILTSGT